MDIATIPRIAFRYWSFLLQAVWLPGHSDPSRLWIISPPARAGKNSLGNRKQCDPTRGDGATVTEWATELHEQGEIALRMARNVSAALDAPDLSLLQAETICKMVRHGARTFDGVIELMTDQKASNDLNELAGQIRDVWTFLAVTAEENLRGFRTGATQSRASG